MERGTAWEGALPGREGRGFLHVGLLQWGPLGSSWPAEQAGYRDLWECVVEFNSGALAEQGPLLGQSRSGLHLGSSAGIP